MNKKPKRKPYFKGLRTCCSRLWSAIKLVIHILTIPVFFPNAEKEIQQVTSEQRPIKKTKNKKQKWYTFGFIPWRRIVNELGLRLLEAPVILFLCIAVTVYLSINPPLNQAIGSSPDGMGLFYKPASFNSMDGTPLQGWYIPSINAREVLEEGDKALTKKRPGVVLCHGIGSDRNQLMPLAYYLNSHGCEVMAFDFRRCGSSGRKARSFGLKERSDVLAAVNTLRGMSSVDPERIYVVGQDMGGVSALWAGASDAGIRGIIVADVHSDLQAAVVSRLGDIYLKDLVGSAFVWGCKTYFHATDLEWSTIQAASQTSPNQRIMILVRDKNQELNETAQEILSRSQATGEKMVVNKVSGCILNDMETVAPAILNFIQRDDVDESTEALSK